MEMMVIAVVAVVAFAAVLVPLFRRKPGFGDPSEFENIPESVPQRPAPSQAAPSQTAPSEDVAADELEQEVQRYRAAVRADTVCGKCGQANPADSAFCFECGERLPRADAKEFE